MSKLHKYSFFGKIIFFFNPFWPVLLALESEIMFSSIFSPHFESKMYVEYWSLSSTMHFHICVKTAASKIFPELLQVRQVQKCWTELSWEHICIYDTESAHLGHECLPTSLTGWRKKCWRRTRRWRFSDKVSLIIKNLMFCDCTRWQLPMIHLTLHTFSLSLCIFPQFKFKFLIFLGLLAMFTGQHIHRH